MIRERLDHRIEKRLEAVLEPHAEEWMHRFFRSERGQALIAEVTADFLISWMSPGLGGQMGYFQRTLLDVVGQLAAQDPEFRRSVVEVLNPHFHDTERPRSS